MKSSGSKVAQQVDAAFAMDIIKRLHVRVHELEGRPGRQAGTSKGCGCECPARSVAILEDRFGTVLGYECRDCRHQHRFKRKVRRGA